MSATKSHPTRASASRRRRSAGKHGRSSRSGVDRAEQLSEEVFHEVEAGQRAAIKAVRQFVDTVDRTLPGGGEEPSGRQQVVDAAMEMADQLVHTQYEFLRKVVRSAGTSLARPSSHREPNGDEPDAE